MRRLYCSCLAVGVSLLLSLAGRGQAQSAAPDSPAAPQSGAAAASSQAVVPRLMKFTGTLRDMAGKPIIGPAEVTFALYAAETGGDPLWFETQSVAADDQGRYTVLLGAMHTDGLPMELFTSGEARWLGVQVGNEAEQKPRVLLLSVPYALKAADAETLGGMPASAFVQTGAGPASGVSGATAQGGTSQSKSRSTPVPTGPLSSTGTQNYISMFTDNSGDTGNSVIYQNGSNIGIGTTNPLKPLHVAFDATGPTPTIIAMTGATNTNRRLLLGYETSANYGVIQSNEASVGYTPLALNPNGGNVGIGMGTAQPKALLQAGAWTQIPSDIVFSGGGVALQGDFFIGNNTIPKTRMYSNGGATAFASNEYYNGSMDKPQNTSLPSWRMYMYFSGGTDYFSIQRSPASSALAYADVLHVMSNGNVGIGTSSPAYTLDVNGSANFRQAVTFASGQTFPGTGTITGVTAGTDLTGGGTSGAVTLSLDTTKVPTLAATSNVFTGSITASSFAGNGSALTSLNASNVTGGTLPSGVLSGTYSNALTLPNTLNSFTGNGAGLTNLSYNNLGGTLPSSALSGTYSNALAFSNSSNSFTGNGPGLTNLSASNLTTGTLPSSAISGTYSNAVTFSNTLNSFTGSGSGLTNLSASNLTTGTLPSSALNGTYSNTLTFSSSSNSFTGNGSALTHLNASNLTSGTLPSSALSGTYSSAVTLSSTSNSFTGNGSGLTNLSYSNLSGTLPSSALSGTYSNAVTFSSTSNSFTGNGSGLTNLSYNNLGGTLPSSALSGTYSNALAFSNSSNSFTGNGSGLTSLSASNLTTGTLPSNALNGTYSNALTFSSASNSFTGNGSGLTHLNASNLTSGVLPSSALSGTYSNAVTFSSTSNSFTGNGSGLTNLSYSNLSGTLPSSALSGTYSNVLTFSNSSDSYTGNGSGLNNLNASSLTTGTLPSSALSGTYSNALTFSSTSNVFKGTSGTFGGTLTVSGSGSAFGPTTGYSNVLVNAFDTSDSTAIGVWAQNNTSSFYPTITAENMETSGNGALLDVVAPNISNSGCTIYTNGNLNCSGSKSAVVNVSGGRKVALYAVESPENWFEDFGSGVLHNGLATVELDPTFAETINAAMEYHVFLTPKGDCEGLYVANESAASFEVRELKQGRSNVGFDYRIVARRKGYEKIRLEDMTGRFGVRPKGERTAVGQSDAR